MKTPACLGVVAVSLCTMGCPEPSNCRASNLIDVPDVVMSVVLSDYASSAIVLVREDGTNVLWLDSGSRAPALVSALSGDIVLPSTQLSSDALVLLDRYQSDVMTVIPFASPNSRLWQADLRGGRTAGTSPNPQDAVALPDGRWLVSRFNPSVADVPELARGNDLVVIDPSTRAITMRIDLHADRDALGTRFFARPTRLAMLATEGQHFVLVGLARLSDLALRETGPGAVALVDAATFTTQVLELDGLSNCGAVAVIPGRASDAYVLCQGDAFGVDEARAGIVHVGVERGLLIERGRATTRTNALPAPGNGLVAIDATHVAYVSHGALSPPSPDRLVMLASLDTSYVLGEAEAFTLGEGAYDTRPAQLLVPDAEMRSVRTFTDEGSAWVEHEARAMPLCVHLPPRQVVVRP